MFIYYLSVRAGGIIGIHFYRRLHPFPICNTFRLFGVFQLPKLQRCFWSFTRSSPPVPIIFSLQRRVLANSVQRQRPFAVVSSKHQRIRCLLSQRIYSTIFNQKTTKYQYFRLETTKNRFSWWIRREFFACWFQKFGAGPSDRPDVPTMATGSIVVTLKWIICWKTVKGCTFLVSFPNGKYILSRFEKYRGKKVER